MMYRKLWFCFSFNIVTRRFRPGALRLCHLLPISEKLLIVVDLSVVSIVSLQSVLLLQFSRLGVVLAHRPRDGPKLQSGSGPAAL